MRFRLFVPAVVVAAISTAAGAPASANRRGVHGYGLSLNLPLVGSGTCCREKSPRSLARARTSNSMRRSSRRSDTCRCRSAFTPGQHGCSSRQDAGNSSSTSTQRRLTSPPRMQSWRRFTSGPGVHRSLLRASGPLPAGKRGTAVRRQPREPTCRPGPQLSPTRTARSTFPPDATRARAGARGVVAWVGLVRPRRTHPFPVRKDPLDLRQAFCTRAWEGAIPGVTQCTLWSHIPGRFEISVYVYLRERSRLGAAQAELRRLVPPKWPTR